LPVSSTIWVSVLHALHEEEYCLDSITYYTFISFLFSLCTHTHTSEEASLPSFLYFTYSAFMFYMLASLQCQGGVLLLMTVTPPSDELIAYDIDHMTEYHMT